MIVLHISKYKKNNKTLLAVNAINVYFTKDNKIHNTYMG